MRACAGAARARFVTRRLVISHPEFTPFQPYLLLPDLFPVLSLRHLFRREPCLHVP